MRQQLRQHKMTGSARKKLVLLCLLAALALALSSCYMEPDRIVDGNDGLTVGTGGQQFDAVITPTPEVTATPTPGPTTPTDGQQIDWNEIDFGNNTATNPPSNVITVGGGDATVGTSPSVAGPTPSPTPAATASSDVLKSGSSGCVRWLTGR